MPQRSPIIVRLLFAATLALDAVATFWFRASHEESSGSLFVALAFSQIALVAVWAVISEPKKLGRRWYLPSVVAFVAACLTMFDALEPGVPLLLVALFQVYAAVMLVAMWILRQLLASRLPHVPGSPLRWQFSLFHALVIMTMIAIVMTIVRSSERLLELWITTTLLVVQNVMVVSTVVFLWGGKRRSWRLAGALVVTMLFGTAASLIDDEFYWVPMNLIQVGMMLLWIHFAALIPSDGEYGSDDAVRPQSPLPASTE